MYNLWKNNNLATKISLQRQKFFAYGEGNSRSESQGGGERIQFLVGIYSPAGATHFVKVQHFKGKHFDA